MRNYRVIATEKVYDVLHAAGLDVDHQCFDDLMFGCLAAMESKIDSDIVDLIYNMNPGDRTKQEIEFDLIDYARSCGVRDLDEVLKKAVAIGKTALLIP